MFKGDKSFIPRFMNVSQFMIVSLPILPFQFGILIFIIQICRHTPWLFPMQDVKIVCQTLPWPFSVVSKFVFQSSQNLFFSSLKICFSVVSRFVFQQSQDLFFKSYLSTVGNVDSCQSTSCLTSRQIKMSNKRVSKRFDSI